MLRQIVLCQRKVLLCVFAKAEAEAEGEGGGGGGVSPPEPIECVRVVCGAAEVMVLTYKKFEFHQT